MIAGCVASVTWSATESGSSAGADGMTSDSGSASGSSASAVGEVGDGGAPLCYGIHGSGSSDDVERPSRDVLRRL